MDHFFKEAAIDEFIGNSRAVILYVFALGSKQLHSPYMTTKQLAKNYCEIIKKYGSETQKNSIILFSKGAYSIDFRPTMSELEKRGLIIHLSEDQYIITERGISWLNDLLVNVRTYSKFLEIREFILQNLYKTTEEISREIFRDMEKFSYEERNIEQFKLILIFDWSYFGKGEIEPYHYSLLYSYTRMKRYFQDIWRERRELFSLEPKKIPDKVNFSSMKRLRPRLRRINKTLQEVMQKDDPAYLREDKFECKNYVYNLWYILEGVNILHILEKIIPSLHDIATICLLNYRYAVESAKMSDNMLKGMRDVYIKNEVRKLCDWGFLTKIKIGKEVGYMLTARCFVDGTSSYSVLIEENIRRIIESHKEFTS